MRAPFDREVSTVGPAEGVECKLWSGVGCGGDTPKHPLLLLVRSPPAPSHLGSKF